MAGTRDFENLRFWKNVRVQFFKFPQNKLGFERITFFLKGGREVVGGDWVVGSVAGRCEGGGQTQRGNDREERGGSHAGREVPVHAAGVQGCRGVKGREGAIRGASLA